MYFDFLTSKKLLESNLNDLEKVAKDLSLKYINDFDSQEFRL
jgi:hypothetical protein